MGHRNYLHVCQHCGIVHATSSSTGPKKCVVCDAFTFSEYEPNEFLYERSDLERRSSGADNGRVKQVSSPVIRP